MKTYSSRVRKANEDEDIFFLPRYKIEQVFTSLPQSIDWGIEMPGIPSFWTHSKGKGVNIALLDSGIAYDHPDLKDAILDAKDFTNSRSGINDTRGHGTHCAGIMAARDNHHGVVGIAPKANLIVGKVIGDNQSCNAVRLAEAINWAVETGAHIIAMSLGSNAHFSILQKAIENAIERGVYVIGAAGNSSLGMGSVDYPSAYEPVITVGAIDRQCKFTKFSARGRQVEIVAPCDQITSTFPPNILGRLSGPSLAMPFVAGVAALVLSKHRLYGGKTPIRNRQDLLQHLSGMTLDAAEYNNCGFGLVNPKSLMIA